jgi:hypothetical protein
MLPDGLDQGPLDLVVLGWIGNAILHVAQKASWEFDFLHSFDIPKSSKT